MARMTVKAQGVANALALFDLVAGEDRNVSMAGANKGGWFAVSFDVKAGDEDWKKFFVASCFPEMRLSFSIQI